MVRGGKRINYYFSSIFKIYSEKNFDIVDCMLFAYSKNENYDIKTFDKKLDKLIKEYENK